MLPKALTERMVIESHFRESLLAQPMKLLDD